MEVNLGSAPSLDEIEISVFGPGYGESIAIHLGENKWIIVDSCIDPISKEPVPLSYLRQIDVKPNEAVKQVVATHWHDDHIRGLSKIIRECKSAEFVCSAALRANEFMTIVRAYARRSMMESSGVQEFYEIINSLEDRKKSLGGNFIPPKFASADRCLWRSSFRELKEGADCTIYALSPSDSSILMAQMDMASLIPHMRESKNRVIVKSPNYLAVVLWIDIGDISILLGSDLEETGKAGTGWSVIVASKLTRSGRKASLFKLPHHGSVTADHPQVWREMLEVKPTAVLTPFMKGKNFLPTKQDVSRICTRTDKAYATSIFEYKSKIKRPKMVERQIQETVRSIRKIPYSNGFIRIRTKFIKRGDPWTVELFGNAVPLNQMYKR